MPLENLISPMNFVLAKDLVAAFIESERNNQITLAEAAGYTNSEIANLFDFKIFSALWTPPDAAELPAVSVWFESGTFPTERQYPDGNWLLATMHVDCFAVGVNQLGIDGQVETSAECNADARLCYLISQVYQILNSEQSWYKGAESVIKSSALRGWDRIEAPL